MHILRKNIIPLFFVVIILLTVIIRSSLSNHFKSDAKKHAQASFNHSVIISQKLAGQIKGNKLFILLDEGIDITSNKDSLRGEILRIPADSLLERKNRKKILDYKGIIMLVSADPSVSARIWMIFSQMGRKDMFIISNDDAPEVLKYEFRPDTLTSPEL